MIFRLDYVTRHYYFSCAAWQIFFIFFATTRKVEIYCLANILREGRKSAAVIAISWNTSFLWIFITVVWIYYFHGQKNWKKTEEAAVNISSCSLVCHVCTFGRGQSVIQYSGPVLALFKHATLQRNNHATLQCNNHATLQRNNNATLQPCNVLTGLSRTMFIVWLRARCNTV
jgi:hypothetical protein